MRTKALPPPELIALVGDGVAANAVSFRYRSCAPKNVVPTAEAIDEIVAAAEKPRPGLTTRARTELPGSSWMDYAHAAVC